MNKKPFWTVFYFLTVATVLALIYLGNEAVTVISEAVPLERTACLVIDAGHGGIDGGAVSCTGIPESTYNLEIAKKLNDLCRLLGYDTRMIRTSDVSVYTEGKTIAQKKLSDLKARVQSVNETDGAILISIHQNTFADNRYSGAQVFFSGTEGSKELAMTMQNAFINTLNPGSERQCKKSDGIYLMEHITKPGVLVECGFLSNSQEEAKLRSKDYQQKLCCVIVTSVKEYLSNT